MKILLCGANGYIGSEFYAKANSKFDVFPIDNFLVKRKKLSFVKNFDYRNLPIELVNQFDVCIWLCGHSSVQQSIEDPEGAFENNTSGLINFSKIFNGTIIYASSGSVYSTLNLDEELDETKEIGGSTNAYDFSKITIDKYFQLYNLKFISLRFGTVVGASKCLREELLLNRMALTAIKDKTIFLANKSKYRPVLFLQDLINCLFFLVDNHKDLRGNIFNLCSINHNMEGYADESKNFFKVDVTHLPDSPTYSFKMNNKKFINASNIKFTNDVSEILRNIKKSII